MNLFLLLVLWTPGFSSAAPRVIDANVFPAGNNSKQPAFTQELVYQDLPDGTQKETVSTKDEAGELVMHEEAVMRGAEILSQQSDQLQSRERFELKRDGKDVVYRTFDLAKSTVIPSSESREEAPQDFITGPSVGPFLKKHWKEIRSGKTVSANFGVFEIGRSVGFDFSWQGVKDGVATVRMKPSSLFISVVVAPIFLYLSEDGKRIHRFVGLTPLKRKVFGNWKSFTAEIRYQEGEKRAQKAEALRQM